MHTVDYVRSGYVCRQTFCRKNHVNLPSFTKSCINIKKLNKQKNTSKFIVLFFVNLFTGMEISVENLVRSVYMGPIF